jgi:hypothetical protein
MIIKFDSLNKPDFVTQDFLLDDHDALQKILGYLIQTNNGSIRIDDGDYIEVNGSEYKVFKASDYSSQAIIQDYIRESIGKELVKELWKDLDAMNLTEAQDLDLVNRILPVLVCLGDGFILRSRKVLNTMTTAGQLTLARKNFILNKIEQALTKI